MKLVQKLLTRFNGLYYRQEYLCVDSGTYGDTLHAFLVDSGRVGEEVTKTHAFVGYNPVVIALPAHQIDEATDDIQMVFTSALLHAGELPAKKEIVASLGLKRIRIFSEGAPAIHFFEAVNGEHRFLSAFHQEIISLHNHWFQQTAGNVFLGRNLYRQVQVAYSIPRQLCLITVAPGGGVNLFPTDLHGPIGNYYVISLRHAGKACEQVCAAETIRLSGVTPDSYKEVYRLGKNHMQPPKDSSAFSFRSVDFDDSGLPVPEHAVSTCLLSCIYGFEAGIHRIMVFRFVSPWLPIGQGGTLAHVHNVYATWRRKKGLSGNYLLR
jgi:hypothetical protein